MDQHRFDDLSRSLAQPRSRRRVLAATLAALVFGGAATVTTDQVGATKPLRGRPYRSTCTADRQCRAGLVCRREKWLPRLDRNRCGCASGYVYCGGSCVQLGTDAHCLECGDTCGQGESCCASAGVGCASMTSVETCGDCDTACDPDLADTCDSDFGCTCGDGSGACPGDDILCCDGGCVDTTDDPDHCGACGNACAGSTECCDRTCTDTDTSADHCGGCGQPCDPGYGCEAGTCVQLTCTLPDPFYYCYIGSAGDLLQSCSMKNFPNNPCTVDADCAAIPECTSLGPDEYCICPVADETGPLTGESCRKITQGIETCLCYATTPNQFCGIAADGTAIEGCSAEVDDDGPGVPANSSSSGTACTTDSDCSAIYVDCNQPGKPCKCLSAAADYGLPYTPLSTNECYMVWEPVGGICS